MKNLLPRRAERLILNLLKNSSSVTLFGARQAGKTSLAKKIASGRPHKIFDLDSKEDRQSLVNPSAEFARYQDHLIVLDEVQNMPELFSSIRVAIDQRRQNTMPGKFILLGSVTGKLLKQSESLAGRTTQLQLHPLDLLEIAAYFENIETGMMQLWDRGGYPDSLLAESVAASLQWREDYINQLIAKDAVAARRGTTAPLYIEVLRLIAEKQGSTIQVSKLEQELQIGKNTGKEYLRILEELMLIRKLLAYAPKVSQRIVKSTKYYICDSGIFHFLLNIKFGNLQDKPRLLGASWEGFVIENLIAAMPQGWRPFFYKNHSGHEIDLVLEKPGGNIWAVEVKRGNDVSPSANFKKALKTLNPERQIMVHGGKNRLYAGDIEIMPLAELMNELIAQEEYPKEVVEMKQKSVFEEIKLALINDDQMVNLKRKEIADRFLAEIENLVRSGAELEDESAIATWRQYRRDFIDWLDLECRIAGEKSDSSEWFKVVIKVLEGMLGFKQKNPADFTFEGLCAYDFFLRVIATLMKNDLFANVHGILSREYFANGEMHKSRFFWLRAINDEQVGELFDFVASNSVDIPLNRLLEAEFVTMLHVLLVHKVNGWPPVLPRNRYSTKLEFFIRASSQEGMVNLCACLGIESTDGDKLNELQATMEGFVATGFNSLYKEFLTEVTNYENWYIPNQK